MVKIGFYIAFVVLLLSCGRENPERMNQFDLLEQSAHGHIQIEFPHFGGHPFSKLMQHLLKKDTLGAFCVGQRSVRIRYSVLWATDKVLSMDQEVWMDCPMNEGIRKTKVNFLFTRQEKQISRVLL